MQPLFYLIHDTKLLQHVHEHCRKFDAHVRLKVHVSQVHLLSLGTSLTSATSMMSNSIDSGFPSCSRCTQYATNAQWLGEDYVSVVKFSFLLYSLYIISAMWSGLTTRANRQHFSYPLSGPSEYHPNIMSDCLMLWYVIFRSTCLHERLKPQSSTMLNECALLYTHRTISALWVWFEWSNIKFNSREPWRCTSLPGKCAGSGSKSPFLSLSVQRPQ